MRAPRRRRPLVRQLASWRTNRELLRSLETRVAYVGSPEHKDMPSFIGQPRPRADASLCPRELTREKARVEEWLREAIRRGAVSELREGDFPRYVWFEQDGVVYEGRLVNRGLGQYKGYPLEPGQGPRGLSDLYA
jgi:hypothetical protein